MGPAPPAPPGLSPQWAPTHLAVALAEGLSQQLPADGLGRLPHRVTHHAAEAELCHVPAGGLSTGGDPQNRGGPSTDPQPDMGFGSPSTPQYPALPQYLQADIWDLPGVAKAGSKGGHVSPWLQEVIWGHREGWGRWGDTAHGPDTVAPAPCLPRTPSTGTAGYHR